MKKLISLLAIFILLLAAIVSATTFEVISMTQKDTNGNVITRDTMYTGETITYIVKTNTYYLKTKGVYVNDLIEAGCRYKSYSGGKYTWQCMYTVEPIAKGESKVYVKFVDQYNNEYQSETSNFYFNVGEPAQVPTTPTTITIITPTTTTTTTYNSYTDYSTYVYEVNVDPELEFEAFIPGTYVNSSIVNVYINKENDVSARLYVQGKKVYSTTAGRCGWSNYFNPYKIYYSVNGGSWKQLGTSKKYIGTDSVNIQFRAKVPSYCSGTYDLTKAITFSSKVITT